MTNIREGWRRTGLVPYTQLPLLRELSEQNQRKKARTVRHETNDSICRRLSDVIPSQPTIPSEDAVRLGQTLKTVHLAMGEESATAERLIHLLEIQENLKQREKEDAAKGKRERERGKK